MTEIAIIRLIDRQEHGGTVLEVYESPDKRRVRFFARVRPDPVAFSQVWTGSEWQQVHYLLNPGHDAITRLFKPTADILGWAQNN